MASKKTWRFVAALVVCGALLISSCMLEPPPVTNTAQQRVNQFLADLNADLHDLIYLNLDPSLEDYEALKDPIYWVGWFPYVAGDVSYSYADLVISEPDANDLVTMTANINGRLTFNGPKPIAMTLDLVTFWDHDPADRQWMISTIQLDSQSVVPLAP